MIGPCPHCGKEDYVYTNNRAYGWGERTYDTDGEYHETSIENVILAPSATVRCASCQEVRRDLVVSDVGTVTCRKGGPQ